MISTEGLDKADVLAALYNASKPQRLDFLIYDREPMSREEAAALLDQGDRFNYLKGRAMKIHLTDTGFEEWAYDRDNGAGAAQRAIQGIQSTSSTTR